MSTQPRKVSRELWERSARVEIQNLIDFVGTIHDKGPYAHYAALLCNRLRELLATETERSGGSC